MKPSFAEQKSIDVGIDDNYFSELETPVVGRRTTVSNFEAEFRRNTLDYISSDPLAGRASSRFDRILSSAVVSGGMHKIVENAHDSDIICVAFSHDGSLMATGGSDHCVKLWDAINLQEIPIFKLPFNLRKKKEVSDET